MTSAPAVNVALDQSSRGRLGLLDGLRFCAAMAVVLFHFTSRSNPSWGIPVADAFPTLHQLTAWGFFGVDLFFVISGFVILMSTWGKDAPRFVASRFGRLMPAYWVGVIATGILLVILWPDRKDVSLTQIGANLTMLQGAFGISHVDGVYWTLWVELRFYLLVGLLLLLGMTKARLVAFAAVWPPIAAIARRTDSDFVASMLIAEDAPLFAAGIMVFLLSRDPRNTVVWLVLLGNTALAAAWVGPAGANQVLKTTGVELSGFAVSLVLVACVAAVAVIALTPLRSVSARWLVGLGALTYPLYLLHEYWGWWMIDQFHRWASTPIVLTVTILALVAAAWVIHRFVERPVGPVLQRGVERSIRRLTTASRQNHPDEASNASSELPSGSRL